MFCGGHYEFLIRGVAMARSGIQMTKFNLGRAGKFANSRRIQLLTEDKSSEKASNALDAWASCARADAYKGSHLIQAKSETKENGTAWECRAPPNC